MRLKNFRFIVGITFFCCNELAYATLNEKGAPQQLIPRRVLFGNPCKASLQISPDGAKLAYLAPDKHDVLNIWVKSMNADDDTCVSSATGRGIFSYWWAHDNSTIFYAYDKDGKENYHLYAIDLQTHIVTNLTPYEDTRVEMLMYHHDHPTRMLIMMNRDDKRHFDVYELDIITKQLTLREKNPGDIASYIADNNLIVHGAIKSLPDGGSCLLLHDAAGAWQPFITWSLDDSSSQPIAFHRNGQTLYLLDSRDSDTLQLVRLDLTTQQKTIVATLPGYDITGAFLHPDTDEPIYASNSKDHNNVMILDQQFAADVQTLGQLGVPWDIVSHTADFQTFIILTRDDIHVAHYHWYHRPTKQIKLLCCARPDLTKYTLQPMQCIDIISRDGLTLHSYLTLPNTPNATNLPLVLLVHGGPWSADRWGYNPEVQLLANRGYAVLQTNFRISTGYGKAFLNAGNKQWGRAMHNDLIDAINWAITKKIADPTRIAIMGGSYGGYAALAGVAFTPDVFCCAIDLFGVSNLCTLIKSCPPYWCSALARLKKRIGDIDTEIDLLRERSPLFSAHNIKKPLLIVQGANDVRCTMIESQQIVQALKQRNIAHEYLVFENEGHGLAKPENRLIMFAAIEKFLAQHLGGVYETYHS